ncbi:MAG: hypothetical protein KDA99_18860, partial [Planctomycetales bacterium]|nr:hypothetical protein [Planctomycetales bacterium]
HNSLEVDDQSAEIVNRYVTESNQAVQQVREAGQDMANRFATEAHRAIDNRFGADGSDSRWGNDAEPSPSTPPSLTLSAPQQSSAAPSMGMARDRSIAPGDPRTDPSNESPPPAETENSSFAMDGYCPVALMEHRKWVRGDRRWGAVHRGRTYLFHSVEAQQAFLNRPDFYAPVLSCYDPVTYVEQQAFITGARQFGVVYDPTAAAAAGTNNQNARIFLFQSEETLTRFWNDPGRYAEAVHEAIRIADSQTR